MEQEINLGTKIGEISAKEIISGSFLQSMRAMLKENSYDFCNLKAIGEAGTVHTVEVYGCSLLQVHSNYTPRAIMSTSLRIVDK